MDSKPRSTIPVAVRIASEQEPVDCSGTYTEQSDGFSLRFCMGADEFTVVHTKAATSVAAKGVMNYDIVLNDAETFTMLKTPYGEMKFAVVTRERSVVRLNDSIRILLEYTMKNDASGEMDRAGDITVELTQAKDTL